MLGFSTIIKCHVRRGRAHKRYAARPFRVPKKTLPPYAVVEQRIVPRLLRCSPHAIRVYLNLCRFANKRSGLAYPKPSRLLRFLGLVPYHTSFLSGHVSVGLTKQQRATRQDQITRYTAILDAAITELSDAGFLKRKTAADEGDGRISSAVTGWYILHSEGKPRNLKRLRFRNATFVIPARLFDCGVFAIRKPHWRETFEPVLDVYLRPIVLALRDHDALRFGGIDPSKVSVSDEQIVVAINGWPNELPCSTAQFAEAMQTLITRRLMTTRRGIFSAEYGHLISLENRALTGDEVALTVLRLS